MAKHTITIQVHQNGYYITREPLNYEKAGWVAESTENMHKKVDELLKDIRAEVN